MQGIQDACPNLGSHPSHVFFQKGTPLSGLRTELDVVKKPVIPVGVSDNGDNSLEHYRPYDTTY